MPLYLTHTEPHYARYTGTRPLSLLSRSFHRLYPAPPTYTSQLQHKAFRSFILHIVLHLYNEMGVRDFYATIQSRFMRPHITNLTQSKAVLQLMFSTPPLPTSRTDIHLRPNHMTGGGWGSPANLSRATLLTHCSFANLFILYFRINAP